MKARDTCIYASPHHFGDYGSTVKSRLIVQNTLKYRMIEQNGGIFLLPVCLPRIWGFNQANQKYRHSQDIQKDGYSKGFGASLYYMLHPIGRLGLFDIHNIGPNSNAVSTGFLVWWLKLMTDDFVCFTKSSNPLPLPLLRHSF